MNDVFVIGAILSIFMVAYGITSEIMLYPHQTNRGLSALKRLISRAYFEILGEMQLDEFNG